MPLTPAVFLIMLVLADGPTHGYAIMKGVAVLTGGQDTMGPGTLYGTLRRMLRDGLIVERADYADAESADARRRYYALTAFGRQVASAEAGRLARLVALARTKAL